MKFLINLNNIFLIIALLSQAILGVYNNHICNHDTEFNFSEVNHQTEQARRILKEEVLQNPETKNLQIDLLQQPQPIRITMDYSLFNIVNDKITQYQKDQLKGLLQQVQDYLQKLLKVIPAQKTIVYNTIKCNNINIPKKYRRDGENNSDLVIWVSYYNGPLSFSLANAIHCLIDPNLKRVTYGMININLSKLDLDHTQSVFKSDFNNILHEFLHILGFSRGLYRYWINPLTQNFYDDEINNYVRTVSIRGKQTVIISTPNILATARKYFGCPTLQGMQLENDGDINSDSSHWEKTILFDELMTADSSDRKSLLSIFTIALLKDTGYYAEIDESMINNIQWGKNKGCDFVLRACQSDTYYHEFIKIEYTPEQCSSNNEGYGEIVENRFMDNCKKINNSVFCEDYSKKTIYDEYKLEYYGANSRCFQSTANVGQGVTYNKNVRCHRVICSPDFTQITIDFPNNKFQKLVCKKQDEGKKIQVIKGQPEFGYITCPDNLREFCSYTPECPKYCSRKGICINGQCKCHFGWTGFDCDSEQRWCNDFFLYDGFQKCVQQCPQDKFANPDKVCRESCPNGYYQDNENKICLQCDISCIKCSGPTMNDCLECGFLTYLEEGKCVKQCSNNFQLIDQKTCEKSVSQGCEQECEKCNSDAHEECTKCKEQFFLNLKTSKCVLANQCPEGTFANGDQCAKCPQQCQQCSSDLKTCLSQNRCEICDTKNGWEFDAGTRHCFNNQCEASQCLKCYANNKNQCLQYGTTNSDGDIIDNITEDGDSDTNNGISQTQKEINKNNGNINSYSCQALFLIITSLWL
ncbi:leishmanolysin family protein, putative [Ichthyophthirius multifiliis]|uniref:Leishmanolysin family protein, putative n=1 Tax=Ichthyophthirius multifiliis TaxID=5932 RepID=G0QSM8_ICHMU|nr:leishmanolysin family protein, putative [Ichthyophthirius multifiliis]EGR31787.1 leishmanolysin family protein, putative [Ichthyophthirius multifiliis]|eukprot:XP_004035273.1 leishmanolysin family protein, putative [Ichthyophthirius multifiliis]